MRLSPIALLVPGFVAGTVFFPGEEAQISSAPPQESYAPQNTYSHSDGM